MICTYQTGDINALLLETTAHGEVLIERVEVVFGVTLGDSSEELVVVEDLIVEGEVVAGNNIDTGILLDLPVLQTKTLALSEELIAGDLVRPVSLGGLLEVTESSHAGETQNRSIQIVSNCVGHCSQGVEPTYD